MVAEAQVALLHHSDGRNLYGLLTPAAFTYALDINAFAQATFGMNPWRWHGVIWRNEPNLPGCGSYRATCILYDWDALGDIGGPHVSEQIEAAKKAYPNSIVEMMHDDSGLGEIQVERV